MSSINYSAFSLRKAFTLVEVLVVITVIAILLGVSVFVSTKYQQTARDSEREAKANVISSALEKYYEANNEYPNCTVLTAQPSTVKSTTLTNLADVGVLKAPGAPNGVNSIQCTTNVAAVTKDKFTYTCTNAANACNEWELKYRKETDGNIVSIASAAGSDAPMNNGTPSVTLSTSLSGSVAYASASAQCTTGTPEYQIRYRVNSGAFPSNWTNASDAAVAINEGDTATFQAQARCMQFGLDPSGYATSNNSAQSRPVTAPTGLSTTVAISGSNAVGTVSGGSCASGTVLQRQIQHAASRWLFDGAWSGFQDIAGTTQSLFIEQGWQMDYHQIARCVNSSTGVASDWTWGPTGSAIRPISTLGAPAVSATGNNSLVRFNFSGSGCPNGTTKEYRWYLYNNAGYSSDWWGPSTGTSFDWNDNSQGYVFGAHVQQRCAGSYTTGAWSAGAADTWARAVQAPGQPHSFNKTLAGDSGIAFGWTAPACGQGTNGEWKADWANQGGAGIRWINPPSGHADYWWYGLSNYNEEGARPGGSWSNAWPSYGFMGDHNNQYAVKPPRMDLSAEVDGVFDHNNYLRMAVQYRCVNPYTGASGAAGPVNSLTHAW